MVIKVRWSYSSNIVSAWCSWFQNMIFDIFILMDIDTDVSSSSRLEHIDTKAEATTSTLSTNDITRCIGSGNCNFLQTNWQVQGYLLEQADAIEKWVIFCFIHTFNLDPFQNHTIIMYNFQT